MHSKCLMRVLNFNIIIILYGIAKVFVKIGIKFLFKYAWY